MSKNVTTFYFPLIYEKKNNSQIINLIYEIGECLTYTTNGNFLFTHVILVKFSSIKPVRTRFVTNLTVLDSHVKRPRQCHLQSVGLKGQALVTRWWVFRGVRAWSSFLHPWNPSPGAGLGGSGFWPFFPQPLLQIIHFSFYTSLRLVSFVHVLG